MSHNPYSHLIDIFAGGLLTAVGSVVAGIYLKNRDIAEERRKLLRGKLEELHLQLYELDKWVQEVSRIAMSFGVGRIGSEKSKSVEDSPIVQINMLVRFYFRSLRSDSDLLKNEVESFRKGLFSFYAEILEGKQPLKNERYSQLIGVPAENIEKKRLQLLEHIENEIQKYI
ncbi:MAG: hypothetical protein WCH99_22270 [Verrucomicrobiota bacterium]